MKTADMTAYAADSRPIDPATLAALPGIDIIRAMIAGDLPRAPIGALIGMEAGEAGDGWVVFTGTPGPQHYNPIGSVHGGYAATLLDSCMGCAIHTRPGAGTGYTTIDLHVTYVRAMTTETGLVTARGDVISAGRRVATAQGSLTDSRGRLLATATTRCLVFPPATAE